MQRLRFKLSLFIHIYCGIIKFRGGQFSWMASILQVRRDVISCVLIYLRKEICLYYSNFSIRGGGNFVDERYPRNITKIESRRNDSTVYVEYNLLVV